MKKRVSISNKRIAVVEFDSDEGADDFLEDIDKYGGKTLKNNSESYFKLKRMMLLVEAEANADVANRFLSDVVFAYNLDDCSDFYDNGVTVYIYNGKRIELFQKKSLADNNHGKSNPNSNLGKNLNSLNDMFMTELGMIRSKDFFRRLKLNDPSSNRPTVLEVDLSEIKHSKSVYHLANISGEINDEMRVELRKFLTIVASRRSDINLDGLSCSSYKDQDGNPIYKFTIPTKEWDSHKCDLLMRFNFDENTVTFSHHVDSAFGVMFPDLSDEILTGVNLIRFSKLF